MADLEKPLLDPESFNQDAIDLEPLPLEEVFEQLRTSRGGLSSADAEASLVLFGPKKLEEKPGEGPDWQDFLGIICLLIINSTISFIEENNAGNAAAALMTRLAPKTKVLRDWQWKEQDATILVPGDIISIKLGDIIPADARLLEGDPLRIDQSALTGESLPVIKKTSDEVFSGSTCKQGEIEAVVIATGVHSFLGKAAYLVDFTEVVGHFQKTAFTSKKDYGKDDREAKWVLYQQSIQGFSPSDTMPPRRRHSSQIADQASRRAEIARLGEVHTLRGHVESVTRLKNLDENVIQTAHTL